MTEDQFRRYRCWTTPNIQHTVFGDIASLGLDADAVFLAAHTSLQLEHVKGIQQPGAEREVAVLRALDSSLGLPNENTLIAVTGPSGSGKSHLVRWVRAQLPEAADNYHLIYVPRELATLRELLGHVLDQMPGPESDAVKDELDKAVGQKRPEQLAEELLDRLRSVLSYELPDAKQDRDPETRRYLLGTAAEGSARREGGLADLLLIKPIREHMLRPEGSISRIINSVRGQRRGGDEDTPEFDTDDWPVKQAGVRSQLDRRSAPLWNFVGRDPVVAVELLNEARNRAVAETLGMRPGVNLGEVFTKTRRRLRSAGQDLVLLFEDLAQFGLFDGELFNHLGLQPGKELAPIRALFAITDGKFRENVPDTVQTRLTHHFRVGELVNLGDQSNDDIIEFTARYLNIARVGRERLIKAWRNADATERESGSWIPNACLDRGDGRECPNRDECWSSFGQVNQTGLYPYNRIALRRAFQKKGDRFTARILVDEAVREFLIEADPSIGMGSFPGESVRDRFNFSVGLAKESIVPRGKLSDEARDRLHRCRVIWADGAVERAGITIAFDLPVVSGTEAPPEAEVIVTQTRQAKPAPLQPLFDWQSGERLPEKEASLYRQRLHGLVTARLDLGALLVELGEGPARVLLTRVLSPNSFELHNAPGQPAGQNRLRFPVSNDDQGVLLLAAARWWWDHGHWEVTAKDRKWDFTLEPSSAQLELDEFLDHAARAAEEALVVALRRGPLDPAAAAVALRASSIMALGRGIKDMSSSNSLEWVLGDGSADSFSPSPAWAAVATASTEALRDVDTRWIASFATARQGDGAPLVVDAARLVPVAQAAASDPLRILGERSNFDEAFSELAQHWELLGKALTDGVTGEASDLVALLEGIVLHLADSDYEELVGAVASAGLRAADVAVFRPRHEFAAFRSACDRLQRTSRQDLSRWLERLPTLKAGGAVSSLTEVMDAQRWASQARSVKADLEFVRSCLDTTHAELSDRLVQDVGVTPEAVAAEISAQVGDIAAMLGAMLAEQEAR
jgi:hypothetical protein